MCKIWLSFFLLVLFSACQHQQTGSSAYRINRVVVDPGNNSYGSVAAMQLRSRLQVIAADINQQVDPAAPAYDLVVRLDTVKYVAPNGPFLLGRSSLKGKMQAGPWKFRFSGSDDGSPGLGEAFDLASYYSPERSFGRISQRIAHKFSRKLAREFGTRTVSWSNLSRTTPSSIQQPQATVVGNSGQVAPPPLTLVGGSR